MKRKVLIILTVFICALAFAVILCSCSSNGGNGNANTNPQMAVENLNDITGTSGELIGIWVDTSNSILFYEFKDDGTGIYHAGEKEMPFSYKDNGGAFEILYDGNSAPTKYAFSIKGKTLTITGTTGEKTYEKQ